MGYGIPMFCDVDQSGVHIKRRRCVYFVTKLDIEQQFRRRLWSEGGEGGVVRGGLLEGVLGSVLEGVLGCNNFVGVRRVLVG